MTDDQSAGNRLAGPCFPIHLYRYLSFRFKKVSPSHTYSLFLVESGLWCAVAIILSSAYTYLRRQVRLFRVKIKSKSKIVTSFSIAVEFSQCSKKHSLERNVVKEWSCNMISFQSARLLLWHFTVKRLHLENTRRNMDADASDEKRISKYLQPFFFLRNYVPTTEIVTSEG